MTNQFNQERQQWHLLQDCLCHLPSQMSPRSWIFQDYHSRIPRNNSHWRWACSWKVTTNQSTERVLTDQSQCRVLKHFLDCIQFNTHTIESVYENRVVAWDSETRLWKSNTRINIGDSIETVRIGGAVYPTLALVNHSCDPVQKYFSHFRKYSTFLIVEHRHRVLGEDSSRGGQ